MQEISYSLIVACNLNLYPDDWKQLPIPDVSPEQQAPVIALVDKILAAKRKGFKRKVARLEKKLDKTSIGCFMALSKRRSEMI